MIHALIALLISAIIIVLVFGLIIWLIDRFLPLDAQIKGFIRAALIIIAVLIIIDRALPLIGYSSVSGL